LYKKPLTPSAEEIKQRGYTDLIQVLQDIPGFDVSIYYGQLYANVYQRGLRTNNTDKTLLLVDGVEENDLWTLQAGIFPENIASIKLHEVNGFRIIGTREKIGRMYGVWRDTVLLERRSKVVGNN